jgi:hypothetical protein
MVDSVTQTLRTELQKCGETRAAVSRATGIDQAVLSRFARGMPLRGSNLDKLATYLGLVLVHKADRRVRKGR